MKITATTRDTPAGVEEVATVATIPGLGTIEMDAAALIWDAAATTRDGRPVTAADAEPFVQKEIA